MRGICINNGGSVVLQEGASYSLFSNGPDRFYVSNFDNENAHFGCFKAELFKPIAESDQTVITKDEEPWPTEPPVKVPQLDENKIYQARLIWRKPGYKGKDLKEYYLRPSKTHAYFYHDKQLKSCGGCFPLHWFVDFEEVLIEEQVQLEEGLEMFPVEEWQQMTLF